MAQRSLTLRELNERGIYLSEYSNGSRVDQSVNARMVTAMKESGLSAADAFRKVLSEDRDLRSRYELTHGRPLELCEAPSGSRALGEFIRAEASRSQRDAQRRFFGVEDPQ